MTWLSQKIRCRHLWFEEAFEAKVWNERFGRVVLFLLETTWKEARNETFKVHEMEQLY